MRHVSDSVSDQFERLAKKAKEEGAEEGVASGLLLVLSAGASGGAMMCRELFKDGDEIDITEDEYDDAFTRVMDTPEFDEAIDGGMGGLVAGLIITMTVLSAKKAIFGGGEDGNKKN